MPSIYLGNHIIYNPSHVGRVDANGSKPAQIHFIHSSDVIDKYVDVNLASLFKVKSVAQQSYISRSLCLSS